VPFAARHATTPALGVIGPAVTVVVDGRIVAGERSARLVRGIVVAPVVPFVQVLATRIDALGNGRLRIEVAGRSAIVRGDADGIAIGRLARALGDRVSYDAGRRTLMIETPVEPPLRLPKFSPSIPPGPYTTFAPTAAPTPRPTIDGIPVPRRTPIDVGPERSFLGDGRMGAGTNAGLPFGNERATFRSTFRRSRTAASIGCSRPVR